MLADLRESADLPGRDARGDRLRRHGYAGDVLRARVARRRQRRRDGRAHDERHALVPRRRRRSATSVARTSRSCSCRTATSRTSSCRTSARPATACCLQAMADQFGLPVTEYARGRRSRRELAPKFSYGCAVFLDSDRVNFQKEGYSQGGAARRPRARAAQEHLAVRGADPAHRELGRVFVVQGGTQKNLAAVKAQVDYIEQRVPDAEVFLHPHCGEAGAIGAAIETLRVVKRRGTSTFVGLDQAIDITYVSINDETTRCNFCPNNCSRTFIDTATPDGETARYISGFSCEKGTVENLDALKKLNKERGSREEVPEPGRLRGARSRSSRSTRRRRCRRTARRSRTSSSSARCSGGPRQDD